MAKIYYKGRDYSRAIGGSGGGGGSVDSTDIPTAGKVSEFDNNAHINSEDMSSQDVEDFLADINAQGTPSEYKKLLWTNPSPGSGFSAQTISLDLSEYDEVEIECLASAGGTDFVTERCLIGKATMAQFVSGGNGYGSGTPFLTERRFTVSTTGITATTGYGCFTGSSDWSYNSTNRMIPYKIYGIKYERVAPPQVEYPNYSTEEQQVGTFIDGKPIYRKCKTYVWDGNRIYDDDFFNGVPYENIVSIRPQVLSNATYIQTTFYWSSTDYCRCWVYGTGANAGRVAIDGSMSVGANMLFVAEYTKTTD